MKNYTFEKRAFVNPEYAVKIASRMGWMPEEDSDAFTITVPNEDWPLVEFIFEYFM
ncbi:MAG: hypothetical protein NC218_07275 [Acetobacter sp.]|nr:hypothetical protein [Acetobacter sp.]